MGSGVPGVRPRTPHVLTGRGASLAPSLASLLSKHGSPGLLDAAFGAASPRCEGARGWVRGTSRRWRRRSSAAALPVELPESLEAGAPEQAAVTALVAGGAAHELDNVLAQLFVQIEVLPRPFGAPPCRGASMGGAVTAPSRCASPLRAGRGTLPRAIGTSARQAEVADREERGRARSARTRP